MKNSALIKALQTISLFCVLSLSLNVSAQRLVLPGDHPDPSVVKIGGNYWASATTSNWFPAFPLLQSKDLVNWKPKGHVFNEVPAWADYYFWAPEMTYDNGKVYVYYSAHKKGGNLCLAVASADKPEGPYTDHGPLMCEAAGSIDAFPMRDENGKLYMIWKEDGNSVNKPTPIWAMEMKEDRTALIGEKKELFRNQEPWEKNLVEGVSMIRHGQYFYAFYAAAGCCGAGCTYVSGVARSKSLMGPWEKYSKNPLLVSNDQWICPGHGSPVEKDGKFYFLYHGYDKETNAFTGRQGLLNEFRFTPDGWVEFVNEALGKEPVIEHIKDNFKGSNLSDLWQWSVFEKPNVNIAKGKLELVASPAPAGAFVGQKIVTGDYSASVMIDPGQTNAAAGLGAIGDEKNTLSIMYNGNKVSVVQLKDGKATELSEHTIATGKKVYLVMNVTNGKNILFHFSTDGKGFVKANQTPIDGTYLPPWDRAVRVGLIAKGDVNQKAVFDNFLVVNDNKETQLHSIIK
jgi:xylan 1,4-beta-xylosidase